MSEKCKKKKSKKHIGKVNPIFYAAVHTVLDKIYKKKYSLEIDNDIAKDIKGPAIVIATHTSDADHILSALTLYPVRPTYIVSEHFIHNPSTAKYMKLMHVITKKMFTPDTSTILNIMRAKHEDAVIVIFPEGRLSCYGHTLPVTDGTAELIKKLGVNLYIWKAAGAYLTFPKWREPGYDRRGKIKASVKLLLSADEIAEKEISEIKEIAEGAILHDDELAMDGVEYKCDDMSLGVDKILFKCPICKIEGRITAGKGHIRCECGLDATLDSRYKLHGAPFERINEWFEWQQGSIDTDTEFLRSEARFGCCKADGFMDPYAGSGTIYMDKDVFKLSGVMHGEKVEFTKKPEEIGAFPISPGDHFDIYHKGNLIYVYPEPDLRSTVKWVCFLDKLMSEKRSLLTNKQIKKG